MASLSLNSKSKHVTKLATQRDHFIYKTYVCVIHIHPLYLACQGKLLHDCYLDLIKVTSHSDFTYIPCYMVYLHSYKSPWSSYFTNFSHEAQAMGTLASQKSLFRFYMAPRYSCLWPEISREQLFVLAIYYYLFGFAIMEMPLYLLLKVGLDLSLEV